MPLQFEQTTQQLVSLPEFFHLLNVLLTLCTNHLPHKSSLQCEEILRHLGMTLGMKQCWDDATAITTLPTK